MEKKFRNRLKSLEYNVNYYVVKIITAEYLSEFKNNTNLLTKYKTLIEFNRTYVTTTYYRYVLYNTTYTKINKKIIIQYLSRYFHNKGLMSSHCI